MAEHRRIEMSQNPQENPRDARLGLGLFALYVVLYAGFILLVVAAPKLIASPAIAGVNLAIVYGFGLIVAALILALVYSAICRGGR
jgi:uncharacterized membrane protein (DUF485 family)